MHAGDLSLLLEKIADEKAEAAAAANAAAAAAAAKAKAAVTAAAPKARKLSTREQKELEELPQRIEAAEAELRGVDEKLSDPKIYEPSRRDDFDRLTATRKELPARIAALYARWEELESVANG
jgi:ATP-binding cassette subfamily F protein uup